MSDICSAGALLAYQLIVCVLLPTLLKMWTRCPMEVVRKIQHIAFSLSILILVRFSAWYTAVAAVFLLVVAGYPALLLVERTSFYKRHFVDRASRGGELRRQLVFVQLSFAILIALVWGGLGARWHYLVVASIMAWGFGDAAAALVGKFLGRKTFVHRWIEGAKTLEGTSAMIVVAAFAVFFTLLCYGGKPWYVSLVVSLVAAPVCGVVELFSRKGLDTLTVPLSAATIILPLVYALSFLPW